ncbi:hypothetical protein [Halochromatium roseum]|uniref:hypothetical protein n=1 Tax=Halochromatium roseum TaxID=391920 RepID=UPI001912CD94|nr:hypothetical protein [Halochromatium roseum]MBK5938103.1 hypothetical protein [Halochromatium roseum]
MTDIDPVHIHTYSGIAFDLRDPRPAMVRLDDIVHSLSLMNRFNGAALFPYSVAQHSLHVAELLPLELRLEGLLHDAAEAYIGDMVSPLKQVMPEYKAVEARISAVVAEVFGLVYPEPAAVKQADLAVLAAEREQVLGPSYGPWFKDFPEPAPITIRPRDWLEIKASFGQALQTEIIKRRAAIDPRRPDAAAESLGDLRLQEARA